MASRSNSEVCYDLTKNKTVQCIMSPPYYKLDGKISIMIILLCFVGVFGIGLGIWLIRLYKK
jgi:hypothetical protein